MTGVVITSICMGAAIGFGLAVIIAGGRGPALIGMFLGIAMTICGFFLEVTK